MKSTNLAENSTPQQSTSKLSGFGRDFTSGIVVFLVALPLCLGIALASGAPLISGLIAGILGGLVVGVLSGSHTSVSGPAAGLTAVVATQIASLGSFEAFLLAVVVGGVIQIVLGLIKAGGLNAFVPSGVIKGLLAAIGVILILKQIPHLVGHDADPEGEMSFHQPDHEDTFSELVVMLDRIEVGAATVGMLSLVLLLVWENVKFLKKSIIPAPLVVVALGVALAQFFQGWGGDWLIETKHMVQVPVSGSVAGFWGLLRSPDFSQLLNPAIYVAGLTIAIVASLETLLNLEAVDRIDPQRRYSPPNRELLAQGVGNVCSGLLGGLPMTSVIVRSSVNIDTGAKSRLSAIIHGMFLLVSVVAFAQYLNMIPLSALAAILLVTGFKLASPKLFRQMWREGRYQFIPFAVTVVVIVLTDLLVGILIGLAISLAFILMSNLRRPMRRVVEKHLGGEVVHVELANQVSFLNRASLERTLREIPDGGHVLLDARGTDYIDPDVLSYIRDFKKNVGPARGVKVSLRGFRRKYLLADEILFVDYSTRELQEKMTPGQALAFLMEGNHRFRTGHQLSRDLSRQVLATSQGQHPMAVVLSCIDSRTPVELILDLGLGDVFSVRVAGNVVSSKILGSIEYSCLAAGAKLVLVLGHTRCGAVTAAVTQMSQRPNSSEQDECQHVNSILCDIEESIDSAECSEVDGSSERQAELVDAVAVRNVRRSAEQILEQSSALRKLTEEGSIAVVGALYDVSTGKIEFFPDCMYGLPEEYVAELREGRQVKEATV